jgi:ferredoxin
MEELIGLISFILVAHVGLSSEDKLRRVGPVQYFLHTLYAMAEPTLLRIMDKILQTKFFTENGVGNWLFSFGCRQVWYLPHGIALTTQAAERLLDFIISSEGPKGARLAVGPCVCQMSLDQWQEPCKKDMVVLYGADIYLSHYKDYTIIDVEEGKRLLRQCSEKNLVHIVDFCMASGKWTFVVCNCDTDICLITRAYLATGEFVLAGPEKVLHNESLCLGAEKCGRCMKRCLFEANQLTNAKPEVLDEKCLGCGLCVTTCPSGARSMTERPDFKHDKKFSRDILLRGITQR